MSKPELLEILKPLYTQAEDGEAKITKFLDDGDGTAVATRMLVALGLLNADGGKKEAKPVPMVELKKRVTKSLTTALEKQTAAAAAAKDEVGVLKPGMVCLRKNCGAKYSEDIASDIECKYCPGIPVFHEGFKYWSCCPKRKTYDFDEFLNFKGCEVVKGCQWLKDPDEAVEEKQCRYDWFQTPSDITLSVFSKCAEPEQTVVKLGPDSISLEVVYERNCLFKLSFKLGGTVDTEKSSVDMKSGSIDVKLKKKDGKNWECLELGAI